MTGQDVQNKSSKLVAKSPDPASATKVEVALGRRLARLRAMQSSVDTATSWLRQLHTESKIGPDHIRLRHDFVFQDTPLVGSDRKLPNPKDRPPASRLISPRGASLRFELIALFEAQMRTPPGERPSNKRPISGEVGRFGASWIDLLASTAGPSGSGRTTHTEREKRARQVRETVKILAADDNRLVSLPNGHKSTGSYEGFKLNHEGGVGLHGTQPAPYTVPNDDGDYFTLPVELFTNGWIHTLEDTEIVFLLMTLREQPADPARQFRITGAQRVQLYGIGQHTYEAHRLLSRLQIVEVIDDTLRYPDGRVAEYDGRNAKPHLLRFTPHGLSHESLPLLIDELDDGTHQHEQQP